MCVCEIVSEKVCVCKKEKERERERERQKLKCVCNVQPRLVIQEAGPRDPDETDPTLIDQLTLLSPAAATATTTAAAAAAAATGSGQQL